MFEGFQPGSDSAGRRRVAASSAISLVVCAALVVAALVLARGSRAAKKPPPVHVVFKRPPPVVTPPPPPPPPSPPRPAPRPRRVAAAASSGPPAAPARIPDGVLAEGDAADFRVGGVASIEWGAGPGGPGGALGGVAVTPPAPPPPPPPRIASTRAGLPPGAVPPRPSPGNRIPSYPDEMRRRGVESLVVLRVLIDADGRVSDIEPVEGEEPFLSAAREVVRTWRYQPAVVNGRPTAARRIIRVPFRLRT